jgi:hypothetical protein
MASKRTKRGLTREESLKAVPVKNEACRELELDNGLIQLSVPVRRTWFTRLMGRLTSLPKYKKMELDEIGSYVWRQVDGRATVRDLIDRLCGRFKLTRREGEVSLTQYLRTLARKNVIGLAVDARAARRRR